MYLFPHPDIVNKNTEKKAESVINKITHSHILWAKHLAASISHYVQEGYSTNFHLIYAYFAIYIYRTVL